MTGGAAFGMAAVGPADVLAFWRAAGPDKWFEKSAAFDLEVRRHFFSLWHAARAGELAHWEQTPEGALALVITLDQFPRNMFRGPHTYATDELARGVAERAIGPRLRPTRLAARAPVLLSAVHALGKPCRPGTLPGAGAPLPRR